MIIQSYEDTLRAQTCLEYLKGIDACVGVDKIILLPIPSTRDNKTILNTKVDIYELIRGLGCGTLMSGYGLPEHFVSDAEATGARVIDLAVDEEFLVENAELTALATLGIFLNSTKISARELRVGIVGYGRIGKKLTNLFLYLGARVKVFTSRPDTRLDLCEYGVATAISSADSDLSRLDILINTAPAPIFARDKIPDGLRIIDLASGNNFADDVAVEKYPSIPAKMFPTSAGRAWGRAVERYILNNL